MPALWKLTGWVSDYVGRRTRTTETKHHDSDVNFGLVTIGQIMGLNDSSGTRLRTADGGDQEVAFGRRPKLPEAFHLSTPSIRAGNVVLPRHEVTITGGKFM